MKYIIEIEPIPKTTLYKAKGFNTLVFDETGLSKLTPMTTSAESLHPGDVFTTKNGSIEYQFESYSDEGHINCINLRNHRYVSLNVPKGGVVIKSK